MELDADHCKVFSSKDFGISTEEKNTPNETKYDDT